MTAQEVENAVALHFNFRQNLIVPNVHWGMGLRYEADLVVLRRSNLALEVEIKVTASDIKADAKKRHCHDSNLFKELWFAVPRALDEHSDIPARAGILSVASRTEGYYVRVCRGAKTNRAAKRWTDDQRLKLASLGCMRIWTLKEALATAKRRK